MAEYEVLVGDCLDVLRTMDDSSVDAVVTDPPYGLSKQPDMVEVLRHWLAGDDYEHKGGGFMGKSWDSFVPGPAIWKECLRVLKPGGHLLAFFGTRTQDIGTLAIRLAGFEIRDSIAWVYGSGFPKSRNVGNDVEGWDGWGTALKPALEPIVVARKPLIGTVAANVLVHGTGALNIDGCRVGFADENDRALAFPGGKVTSHAKGSLAGPGAAQDAERSTFTAERNQIGRWPANLIHDGSDEVVSLFPDTESGARKAGTYTVAAGRGRYGEFGEGEMPAIQGSRGSAARFFYCAKANKRDRTESGAVDNRHPTVKPTDLMAYLLRLVTPPGGTVLDPFCGSGSTGKAAMLEGFGFIGIEREYDYARIAENRIQAVGGERKYALSDDTEWLEI